MSFWQLYKRNRSAVFGLMILIAVFVMAALATLLFPDDPFELAGKPMSAPGTNGFLLGSDTLGRDVASGIAHGARTSLLIASLATAVAVLIGGVFGGLGLLRRLG